MIIGYRVNVFNTLEFWVSMCYSLIILGRSLVMFGIGLPEIIVILIIALLIFDVKKLPNVARSLGKAVREFKKAQRSFTEDDSDKLAG